MKTRAEAPELSLVFPACDEAANLSALLDRALEIAASLTREFEIVVVDDGSRDGSPEIVREPRLRCGPARGPARGARRAGLLQ
jgi:glycosyltransferase involved in cell wall biosynthesis